MMQSLWLALFNNSNNDDTITTTNITLPLKLSYSLSIVPKAFFLIFGFLYFMRPDLVVYHFFYSPWTQGIISIFTAWSFKQDKFFFFFLNPLWMLFHFSVFTSLPLLFFHSYSLSFSVSQLTFLTLSLMSLFPPL